MDGDFAKFMFLSFVLTSFIAIFVYSVFALILFPLSPQETMKYIVMAHVSSMSAVAVVFLMAWELAKLKEERRE
jgi:uncharacterized membrane protein